MKKNKGLFLSHADDKSGAPKALYNILKFILTHYTIEVDVFICQPRTTGFFENLKNEPNNKGLATVRYLKHKKSSKLFLIRKLENLIKKIVASNAAKRLIKNYNENYDFIFFNSVSYNFHRTELEKITIPKYLYLHEGSIFLNESLKGDYSIFDKFDQIFVPSKQVEKDLIKHHISASKITLLQLFLNHDEIINGLDLSCISNKTDFVVGNLAYLQSIKGIEYFLATAKLYKELHPNDNIIFKWKGCSADTKLSKLAICEIQNAGLNHVFFLEEYSKNTKEFFISIDVLMTTSKQETFGYVILEAANNYKPSIVFDGVIGASEFIKEYGGFVADYLSINQLVGCLKKYYDDRNLLSSHGIKANMLLKSDYSLNKKAENDLKSKLSIVIN